MSQPLDSGPPENPEGIGIRRAEPADFDAVAAMHYPSWRESYRGVLMPDVLDLFDVRQWVDEEYPKRLDRIGWSMWVAESDERLLGMSISGPDPDNPDQLEIDSLYVAVDSGRRGVGGLLLDNALHSQPSGDVVVWCAEKNYRARRFYEKNGFRLDGRAFTWTLVPGVLEAPQLGYRLHR